MAQRSTPAEVYRIHVRERLDPHWSEWLDGLTMEYKDVHGGTILTGPVIDQAALHGVLMKIRDLGLTLLAVSQVEPGHSPLAALLARQPGMTSTTRQMERQETTMINAVLPYQKQYLTVLGQTMAYVEVGQGDPILFLHGNPTSSYLWRNVIPYLEPLGRCIAPDLIGMGDSAKLPGSGPGSYTFVEHRRYLDALIEALGVRERVTLVVHDWGSALGFDWANRHREAVQGIAYMEAIVQPRTWEMFPQDARSLFQALRSEAGEAMILERNVFVEQILAHGSLRTLTDEEMAAYRRPFAAPGEGRRPTLAWPRQIPIEGEPAEMVQIVTTYGEWLAQSDVPKLFVRGEPGAILTDGSAGVAFCRRWPAQTEVAVPGIHFLQEDSSKAIGQTIAAWLVRLRA